MDSAPGRIVILNGVPRSGKSSIAAQLPRRIPGVWLNLGVDGFMRMTPAALQPGLGLRPGGERPDLEPVVGRLYRGLYESIAVHSRLGVDVVVDVGHHDEYSRPLGILPDCARRLAGLPAWFVGVRCTTAELVRRRADTWGDDALAPVERWVSAVDRPDHDYDLVVDTTTVDAATCAAAIADRLQQPGTALARLADGDGTPAAPTTGR